MAADAPGARLQRLHPLSPAFEISRFFFRLVVPGLVLLFFARGDKHEALYMLAFVPAVGYSLKRFLTLRYQLTANHIVVREGLFFRKTRHIPYARIQNIDTIQNPLHRMLGVAEVRLETAGGKEPEAVFRVLTTQRLAEIRAGVFADRRPEPEAVPKGSAGRAAVEAERRSPTFFRMRPLDVVLFGLLSQKGLALLGGLTFLVWELNLWERFKGRIGVDLAALSLLAPGWLVAAVVFALLVGLQALTVTWAFLTLYDFHIARSGEDLSTTCGLWTRQSATLPRRRIQFLSVRESWLHRLAGRISIRILTAGGEATEESRISRRFLVPLVERAALEGILREVQPEISFAGVSWSAVHPRARRRMFFKWMILLLIPAAYASRHIGWWALVALIPVGVAAYALATLRMRRLGYAVTDRGILLRDGVMTHVRNAVQFSRIQSVSLTQNPFDRRHRMATLHVDTAGTSSDLSFAIPYLDLTLARRVMRRLKREASRVAFRW